MLNYIDSNSQQYNLAMILPVLPYFVEVFAKSADETQFVTEIASKCLICWRQRVTCELHHADVTTAVQTQTMASQAHYAPLCSTIMLRATISQPFTVIHTPILALKLLRWQLYLNYIPATISQPFTVIHPQILAVMLLR